MNLGNPEIQHHQADIYAYLHPRNVPPFAHGFIQVLAASCRAYIAGICIYKTAVYTVEKIFPDCS